MVDETEREAQLQRLLEIAKELSDIAWLTNYIAANQRLYLDHVAKIITNVVKTERREHANL